jgi:hypothetical protein
MKVSLVLNHSAWRPERVACKQRMLHELTPLARGVKFMLNDRDFRGQDWQGGAKLAWHLDQWRWSASQDVDRHVFMTDDLALGPRWWDVFAAIVEVVGEKPIGFLSNAPRGPELAEAGHRFYRTNSWIVGPCYSVTHEQLIEFLAWYEAEPDEMLRGPTSWNDDNAWNNWITFHGPGESWHPLPTIIEHDPEGEFPSTVGHGDSFSRERISWRRAQHPASGLKQPRAWAIEDMVRADWWREGLAAPMLPVGGA